MMKSYRPWEDPLIDMGESTGEEEEDEAYVVKDREDGEEEGRKQMVPKMRRATMTLQKKLCLMKIFNFFETLKMIRFYIKLKFDC